MLLEDYVEAKDEMPRQSLIVDTVKLAKQQKVDTERKKQQRKMKNI